jgi:hypothetical protein
VRFVYSVVVDNERDGDDGFYVAFVGDQAGEDPEATPLRARGNTPILALAALAKVLEDWAAGGADRWCATPRGQALVDHFTLGTPPPADRPKGVA